MMRVRHDGQTNEERVRDVRIMVRQGKSAAYIRQVFGWSSDCLRRVCQEYQIPLPPDARTMTNDPAPSLRTKRAPALRSGVRTSSLTFSTEPDIAAKLVAEATRANCSVSAIVHRIVAGAQARGMWADFLDSDSVAVASASSENQGGETVCLDG